MASHVIPDFRYADAPAMIRFLCDAFGFERRAVYADAEDPMLIQHAQLTLGDGMIMLSSARRDGSSWRTPAEAGGNTASAYAYVPDPDAHCARARATGAVILEEPQDNDGYSGRGYSARDPEELRQLRSLERLAGRTAVAATCPRAATTIELLP